jgi:copper chaperone CopZ
MSCEGCVGAVKRVLGKMEGLFLPLLLIFLVSGALLTVLSFSQHTHKQLKWPNILDGLCWVVNLSP